MIQYAAVQLNSGVSRMPALKWNSSRDRELQRIGGWCEPENQVAANASLSGPPKKAQRRASRIGVGGAHASNHHERSQAINVTIRVVPRERALVPCRWDGSFLLPKKAGRRAARHAGHRAQQGTVQQGTVQQGTVQQGKEAANATEAG